MNKISAGDVCLIVGLSGGIKNLGKVCIVYKTLDDDMALVKGDRLTGVDITGLVSVKQSHLIVIGGSIPLFSF